MLRFLRQAAAYLAVEASGEVESASSLANDPDAATTCDSPTHIQIYINEIGIYTYRETLCLCLCLSMYYTTAI